jgi:hypothetical protein
LATNAHDCLSSIANFVHQEEALCSSLAQLEPYVVEIQKEKRSIKLPKKKEEGANSEYCIKSLLFQ